ncbi:Copia protein (Gag-int-pol protein) [Cleaved into: Copia VLP protein [Durusdinium trenchii]|uniref:Copia protein (Gag-int-pol protein) [Cleaved into: Copia VLP protein n=1 Tax=Durusdinium trenchii TaxID=1381693 RepID=A0ABP0K396_9DINO
MELEVPMDSLGFYWVETGEPVQLWNLSQIEGVPSFSPLTGPDMFDQDAWEMSAIRFDHGHVCEHMPMKLGGRTVLIWKPTAIIDDQTLDELNVEQGFVGMQEEIYNLEHCKTGKTISETDMKSFCKRFPSARLISSRWVAAFKSAERVRTRIVAKDFNRGQSARSLGFSSPTPSIEALHLILAISATRRYLLRSLDISHAFMHSPLGKDMHVVLKLPLSVSLDDGQPAFLVLDKALNGLRDASLCWLQLLSETVKTIGLWTDSIEPCVYRQIPLEGGSLTFIGRIIQRVAQGDELLLSINPSYLDSTFKEYGIDKGSDAAPDVASHLEKTMTDESAKKPLSSEAYGRFRRALGKLLWMSQVRLLQTIVAVGYFQELIYGRVEDKDLMGRFGISLLEGKTLEKPLHNTKAVPREGAYFAMLQQTYWLSLHVWLVHSKQHMIQENEGIFGSAICALITRRVFEWAWVIVRLWLKQEDVPAMSIGTELEHFMEYVFGFCAALDEAFLQEASHGSAEAVQRKDNELEEGQVGLLPCVKQVLWSNVFFGACAHDHLQLEELAVYLIRQRIALEALPRTAFFTRRRPAHW